MDGANDNASPLEPKGVWIDGIGYVTEPPEWTGPKFELPKNDAETSSE